ncbi:SDR family oxidoreductase [Alteromonas pelagimontana]|uniref:SDR family oxidoreductase n=1 Tax=Alteromonas pelagimontana TaxID=1858656 RepID=A0A6M4MBU8_9ALTE|nr:SDR family oxidoreductase [Alteromonas pelagimontana]QJR80674.1 SDR family oxidoreductase [Alteromonas pelagimontana]
MTTLALITGGSRGLGKNTALALADSGTDIIITYHSNEAAAKEVVTRIQNKGRQAQALQLDTRDIAALDDFISRLKALMSNDFGCKNVNYLVNNAGSGVHAMMAEASEEILDDMLNVHVKGPFFLTQKMLPVMADGGRILNISSGLTRFSFPGSGPYAMAKGAVEVMTRYMAKELGERGIRVNTLAPGAIETDFRGGAVRDNKEMNAMIASQTALGRVGLPDDIGGAIKMLLSSEAGWINGQRIEASGGMML